ncbi:conserved domain protein [Myxococcus xanthus DK 1622]|uniref:Conserved domain protein n=1 Tax=Myxococcus xanthus (strain DK1622) TaxID=246197 RepID=Q1D6W8_MYXXD|nr:MULTISPECIES: hypothetical protein [Myxococcus]ABF87441.1 conserved domain protein [Myxococcus xanthus DK 1622]NOJ52073.1 hypothetical protein [Myxococcus xanthus]QPM82836.1 hypothetical protein I5Q59_16855 [Myxococcus xanthus]QVW65141.1 hypothetical protein JTM82_22200 [Myxococcus xanthus DZ2]QZZ51105.1 hypothetical protein MyxoNM_18035 [Myxococcus xanthus]
MIICPLCDHVQPEGTECDVCGKRFPAAVAETAPIATLPELEVTPHAGGRAPVVAAVLPDLDVTRLRSGPDLPAQVVPDLQLTRARDMGAVPVTPMPELDTGRAPDDGVRTAAPLGAVVCRYCRITQAEGLLCDNCGMRLPRAKPTVAAAPGRPSGDDDGWRSCASCHTRVRPGKACPECGTRAQEEA